MRFLISGSSGFVGSYLTGFLRTAGHDVRRLVRHNPTSPDELQWNPDISELDPGVMQEIDEGNAPATAMPPAELPGWATVT